PEPTQALNPASENDDAFPEQVSALKQAPPPSRKIIRFLGLGFTLTPMPGAEPSRHIAPSMGTNCQVLAGKPMIGVLSIGAASAAVSLASGIGALASPLAPASAAGDSVDELPHPARPERAVAATAYPKKRRFF